MKSDPHLQQDVQAESRSEPSMAAARSDVEGIEGIVMPTGPVASHAEKWDAEGVAQRIAGGRAATLSLELRLADGERRDDASIARLVGQARARDAHGVCQVADHILAAS